MPCADAKGLFPGRGAPPGRGGWGAGDAEVDSAAAASAGPADGTAGATLAGAAGAGVGDAAGDGVAGAVGATFVEASAAGVDNVAVTGASAATPDAAGALDTVDREERTGPGRVAVAVPTDVVEAPDSEARAARSLRATGGSMVDEGLLTNSPSSFSFASATLLSTPSSEAISCTRGFAFATVLLSGGLPRQGRPLVADGTHFEPFTSCP